MRLLALALALSAVLACSTSTTTSQQSPAFDTPAVGQTAPAQPSIPGDPCQINGQTYCLLNPAVTQATIGQTICVTGWTKTIRPPASYTSDLKRRQLAQFASAHAGDPQWTMAGTEEDHRLPLEVGGFSGGQGLDEHNLSPEVHRQSTLKDQDENTFRHKVCSGEPLKQAQAEFVAKWLRAFPEYAA